MIYPLRRTLGQSMRFRSVRLWAISVVALLALAGASGVAAQTPPPALFFTDLDSGPNAGGESVGGFSGAYVTLYGNFFGSSQGTSTVTWNGLNCLRVVPATGAYTGWGAPHLWYQKIVVQLGSGCTPGPGNFVVSVSGRASNGIPFTVRTNGNIFCVSTSGADSNSGKFPSCWATILNAKGAMAAGDVTYVQNGVNQTSVEAFDANLSIMSSGTSANPIALSTYPGASSTIGSPNGTASYGIRTPNIGTFVGWTIAGFTVRSSNIAVEISGGASNFRVIGIDASCPNAVGRFQGGCMDTASIVSNVQYLGNYDHDNAQVSTDPLSSTKGFHNMYFSTDSNHIVAAWNLIDGDTGQRLCNGGPCNACRGIQFNSSPIGPGTGLDQFDLHVHDNVIRNIHCDAINFATVDASKGPVRAYNNLIYHVGTGVLTGDQSNYMCISLVYGVSGGTAEIYNNTCYDFGAVPGNSESGAFGVGAATGRANFRNNIVYALPDEPYITSGSAPAAFLGSNNLFFGNGSGPAFLTSNVNADPKFVNTSGKDFHLQSGSPAIGAGLNTGLTFDLSGVGRPSGTAYAIGAYEFSSGSAAQRPNPPTNLVVTVQ